MILKWVFRSSRRLLQMALSSLIGAMIVLIAVLVFMVNNGPELEVWHTTELENEYRANGGVDSFEQYLALEDSLFKELEQSIYQKTASENHQAVNRYFSDSLSDSGRWPVNWNHTFVLTADRPVSGVLLLHGMSDSPYSLRSLGQTLHAQGASVIGLRIPGHGQLPSGLLNTDWEDMAAAVRLAVRHLRQANPDVPLYLIGYSNGGALAVHYALETLDDSKLPKPQGLVLLSPEIGVSKLAALAVWQERLGHVLGLEKLSWNGVLPEYDPWKYGSFALNAGKQAYEITLAIQKQISRQSKAGKLNQLPPMLAFQSVVDATVSSPALVNNLFNRLPPLEQQHKDRRQNKHELVLFDINRFAAIEPLLKSDPAAWARPLLEKEDLAYDLTLMSNKDRVDRQLISARRVSGSTSSNACETSLFWPENVYSLSHVALPFPPDDPIYGQERPDQSPGLFLGTLALRGERNVLQVSSADMLRLRSNPFYDYLEGRVLVFMGLADYPMGGCMLTTSAGF